MALNKKELVQQVSEKAELTKKQATVAIDSLLESIVDELAKGEKVSLAGLGTFSVRHNAERPGRNPSTGEEITISARNAPKFSPAQALKSAVNK